MLTIAQLTKVVTEEQALAVILDELEALKFQARSWQSGSIPLTLVHVFARLWANGSSAVADIAAAGFNDLAIDGWLDLFSLSHYKNARKRGSATQGYLTLTAAANALQARYFIPTEAFVVVIALYWAITICLELAVKKAGMFGTKRGFENV